MSLLVLVITALRKAGYLKEMVTIEHYHIMGKWMLAFTVFWAYIGFSQYMLIWYANIPEETQYFILRNTESWWALSLLLVIGRFFIPFAILLMQSIKKHPRQLCLHRRLDRLHADARHLLLCSCPRCTAPAFISAFWISCRSSRWARPSLSFILRLVRKASLFPCAIRA